MKEKKPFSIRARAGSFKYALEGIRSFFQSEHNAIIHLLATLVVTGLAFILPVSGIEIILLVIVIGLVWITELLNTAMEKAMDLISPEKRQEVKLIKDLSAAAVLLAALTAVITGGIIFIPKF